MQFTDRMISDGQLKKTDDGWVVQARVARSGNIQMYSGAEIGMADRAVVRIYRPEEEVFDRKSIESYARKPITMDHPPAGVTNDNWKDLAVGEIDRDVVRDGEFVSVPLLLRDAKAVERIKDGARELSMGYTATIEWEDGVTPSGERYDAVQRNLRMNHVAVVDKARGGKELRIGDSWGVSPVTDAQKKEIPMTLRTILVDGLSVETTDAGAQAITKLQDALKDKDAEIGTLKAEHNTAIQAKDAEIGTLKAEKKALEDAAPKPEDLDRMVADRAELVGIMKAVDKDFDTKGKTDVEIRKAVVAKKMGDAMVADASDAEIAGMFRVVADQVSKEDPLRKGIQTGSSASAQGTIADQAYADSIKGLTEAYLTKEAS